MDRTFAKVLVFPRFARQNGNPSISDRSQPRERLTTGGFAPGDDQEKIIQIFLGRGGVSPAAGGEGCHREIPASDLVRVMVLHRFRTLISVDFSRRPTQKNEIGNHVQNRLRLPMKMNCFS